MLDFAKIIDLRRRRLDRAQKNEADAKAAFAQAGKVLISAKRAVDEFLEATRTLEIDLLNDLLSTSITTNDVLRVEEILRRTEVHAQGLDRQVAHAKVRLNEAGQNAEAAFAQRRTVELKLTKGKEIQDHILQVRRQENIAAEEAEIDQFSELMSARDAS